MEAGLRNYNQEIYRTPISIFDAIQIAAGRAAKEEEKNLNEALGKPEEKKPDYFFPLEIF